MNAIIGATKNLLICEKTTEKIAGWKSTPSKKGAPQAQERGQICPKKADEQKKKDVIEELKKVDLKIL